MATLPTRLVEWEFDAGVWTDITADFVAVETNRGRNRELGSFETGTMVLTLRNETRKYDPEYAAGPYYGKLRPNRRIRFRATYSAVTYPVIVGYVDRITQTYDGPNGAVTTVACSDLFKVLNRVELPPSVYAAEVKTDAPVHWWRMGEPAGSTVLADGIAGINAALLGGTLGTPGLLVRDSDTALTIPGGTTSGATVASSAAWIHDEAAQEHAVELLVRFSAFPAAGHLATLWGQNNGPTGTRQAHLYVDNTGQIHWEVVGASGLINGPTLALNTTYHVVAQAGTITGTWTNQLYVNATLAGTSTSGTLNGGPLLIGAADPNIGDCPSAIIDEFAVYGARLAAGRITAHYLASITPWVGDLPGARAGRILDVAGIAAGDRSLDTGSATLQASNLGGSALAYLQKIEQTELAEVFITRDGKVRLLGRQERETGGYLTSTATFADATPAAGEVPYTDVSFDVDDAGIIDRATVSRDGSVALTYSDAAAVTEFGLIDFTAEGLLHDSDAYSFGYAQWIVNTHRTPSSRIGNVQVDPTALPATAYPKILGLEIGDRVTLKRRPKVGAAITYDYRVEAIAHATGVAAWVTTLQLTPFNLAGTALWVLEVAGNSELGQTTTLGL